jgi:hypothetical protein
LYLLVVVFTVIFIAIVIIVLAFVGGKRPFLTGFEARQRNIRKTADGEIFVDEKRDDRAFKERVSEGVAMATDLRYLSEKVGGQGYMGGTLYAGESPRPRKVRVRVSGNVPMCPLCGMPMERVNALRKEKAKDYLIPMESDDKRWKCYHEFPVIFVPDKRSEI